MLFLPRDDLHKRGLRRDVAIDISIWHVTRRYYVETAKRLSNIYTILVCPHGNI